MKKPLNVTNTDVAARKIPDLEVIGNPGAFRLLCKASSASQRWMKATKAYEISGKGCIVQATTQNGDRVAEALVFIPNAKLVEDENDGWKLV